MYTHATDAGWISRSHRAIAPFRLASPANIGDALTALSQPGTIAIAGGIDLIRRQRSGDRHQLLIDLSGLDELRGISRDGDMLTIAALTTHWEIETSALIGELLPAFQDAWKTIGNIRVRMAGTLGGNLMANEPGYDGRMLLGALDAVLDFATSGGETSLPATATPDDVPAGSLLLRVRIPLNPETRLSFDRSLKPVVSVAVALDGDRARIGVGCAHPVPQFWSGPVADVSTDIGQTFDGAIDTPLGSAAYRQRMIGVLAMRQLRDLTGEGA